MTLVTPVPLFTYVNARLHPILPRVGTLNRLIIGLIIIKITGHAARALTVAGYGAAMADLANRPDHNCCKD